jgi:hypothetical protein
MHGRSTGRGSQVIYKRVNALLAERVRRHWLLGVWP